MTVSFRISLYCCRITMVEPLRLLLLCPSVIICCTSIHLLDSYFPFDAPLIALQTSQVLYCERIFFPATLYATGTLRVCQSLLQNGFLGGYFGLNNFVFCPFALLFGLNNFWSVHPLFFLGFFFKFWPSQTITKHKKIAKQFWQWRFAWWRLSTTVVQQKQTNNKNNHQNKY